MAYTCTVVKDKLIIEIDVSPTALKAAELARSGKCRVVATSSGWVGIHGLPDDVQISLTLITAK